MIADNSILRAVARCTTEATVRYALHYTSAEDRMELRAGTATHLAMQRWFESKGDDDAAFATFEAHYREWADANVPADHRLAWQNVSRIMRYWYESHPYSTLPYRVSPERVEVGFNLPLVPGVRFVGRLDGIATFDGATYVLEHKTTGRLTDAWERRWRLDSQLSGYVWAARQQLPRDLVVGVMLNAIEFGKLPDSDRRCTRHAVAYAECGHLHGNARLIVQTRDDVQIAAWRRTAIRLAMRLADLRGAIDSLDTDAERATYVNALPQEGTFNYGCPTCGFATWCEGGRRYNELTANFVVEPWYPLDHVSGATRNHTGRKP